jgi:NADH:ubiquinone oxidoreductase subunit 4 (subunit M)
MNSTYVHLLLNHFPIIGTLVGSGLLLWGMIKKQAQTQSIAAGVLFLMAIIALPVYLTGEPAEENVENLPGISETMMELHEESANLAIWIMGITGIVSLVAIMLHRQKHAFSGKAYLLAFLLSVVTFGAMVRTGYDGGRIRHSEIRDLNAAGSVNENGGAESGEKDDDD